MRGEIIPRLRLRGRWRAFVACMAMWGILHQLGCRHLRPANYWESEYLQQSVASTLDDEFLYSQEEVLAPSSILMAQEPIRPASYEETTFREMTLQDVIFEALSHAQVIRQNGDFLSPGNPLLRSPESIASIYDQAIQESGVLFGQRGVHAALSEFDTQFTTRMLWGNSSQIQNNQFTSGGIPAGLPLVEDTTQFQAVLQKSLESGGQIGLSHNINYSSSNAPGRLFPSVYDGNVRIEFRQPLLAGAGEEYTAIAGPISENIQGVTGVQQGLLIARINNDQSLLDFELAVAEFIREVENHYWQLYVAYESYELRQLSLLQAQQIFDLVKDRKGSPGGDLSYYVEAQEGVLQAEATVEEAWDGIYTAEIALRNIMSVMVDSNVLIRPLDHPVVAEIDPNWDLSLGIAMTSRPELRKQKLAIKSAQLQLKAAENLNRPRLDFLLSGQSNAFGDDLMGARHTDGTNRPLGSAYHRLFNGTENGWNIGAEYSQPLGMRFAQTQVKNQELKLTKAIRTLEAQEMDVLHQLTQAFNDLERQYKAMQKQAAIVENAQQRLVAAEEEYNSNRDGRAYLSLDGINRARQMLTDAETDFLRRQVEYSLGTTQVEYRTGQLLQLRGVMFGRAPQPGTGSPTLHSPMDAFIPLSLSPLPAATPLHEVPLETETPLPESPMAPQTTP